MIFILCEEKDVSTDLVIEWLLAWGLPYKRVNDGWNSIKELVLTNKGADIIFKENFSFSDVCVSWFRRGYFLFDKRQSLNPSNKEIEPFISKHLTEEVQTLKEFTYHLLKTKPSVNHPLVYNASKLIVLHKAIQVGLNVPETLVTNSLSVVEGYYEEQEQELIVKNIQDVISIPLDNQRIGNTTTKVEEKDLEETNDSFFYSLFQRAIPKKYELRVFYFMGNCYSCAIFSQLSEKTKDDSRLEDKKRPNRVVPYLLPKEIEAKVDALMRSLEMESGSIDFIVDDNLEHHFLEVNPVGQFDYVSKRCNYYLEYEIAACLKKMYEKDRII